MSYYTHSSDLICSNFFQRRKYSPISCSISLKFCDFFFWSKSCVPSVAISPCTPVTIMFRDIVKPNPNCKCFLPGLFVSGIPVSKMLLYI